MMDARDDARRAAASGPVGQRHAHDSAIKHATGQAVYVDDIVTPVGTLEIYIGQSTEAHARVTSMDLAHVRTAAGVVAVLSVADIPGHNDLSPTPTADDPLFADGLVQYVGQALFAVVARTVAEARAAARLAVVVYEPLPAVLTIADAMKVQSFLEPPYVIGRGDVDAALERAPHLLEGALEVGGQEHFYLEGQAALAVPGEDGDMTVYTSSQHPSEIQHKVADVLGVAANAVTVEVRRMGGGFGGKESQGNLPAVAAALAARVTGRAVKCVYDRDDDMMLTGKRHDVLIRYRVGYDDAGRLLAMDVSHAMRCGMSFDLSQPVADRAMLHADNCYFIPDVRITSYRLKTHTQSNTAFRGFGGPQGMIGIETILDRVARAVGRDALEVRRVNFYGHRSEFARNRHTTPYHMDVEDCVIQDIVDDLVVRSDYMERREAVVRWNHENRIIKRGLSLTPVKFGISFTKSFLNQAGALVHVYSDGSVHLNHGGTEMGQGLNVKVAQVVAEVFGIAVERVKITATNTGKVPNTSATAASSGSDLNGMAAFRAAQTVMARLAEFVAERAGVAVGDVTFAEGQVIAGATVATFAEVARDAYMARVSLSSTGYYATPKVAWDRATGRGRPFFYFAYGAAVSEVAIDTLTGESRIVRADIVHDVGRSLNPAIDRGQIEGGFVQGAGWLTTEELVWDSSGRLLTHAPSTYKIPVCSDRPSQMSITLFESGGNTEETIYRSKAVGEPPLMLGISVFSALADAVASVGDYRVEPMLDAPATPERVLMAVERVRKATGGHD